jgi:hypothetical protein
MDLRDDTRAPEEGRDDFRKILFGLLFVVDILFFVVALVFFVQRW